MNNKQMKNQNKCNGKCETCEGFNRILREVEIDKLARKFASYLVKEGEIDPKDIERFVESYKEEIESKGYKNSSRIGVSILIGDLTGVKKCDII